VLSEIGCSVYAVRCFAFDAEGSAVVIQAFRAPQAIAAFVGATIAWSMCACAATVASENIPSVQMPTVQTLLPALLDDAARRSGVAAERLRVLSVEAVTWSDGALGCPQPGRLYPQVLVPGHRVRIVLPDGTTLDYHSNARGGWLHCPTGQAQPPLPRGADPRI
jgi:hypothetical protein